MVPVLTDEIHDLDIEQAFSLDRIDRCTIRGIEGQIWLTQEGLTEDLVLAPGDCCTIRTRGRVAMEALDGPARFAVSRGVRVTPSLGEVWRAFWQRLFVKRQTLDCQ
jgi:hypothetical protein